MAIRPIIFSATLIMLFGCSTLTPEQQNTLSKMSACEKVQALVKGSQNKFEDLKNTKLSSNLLTSWSTKANLIGDDCRINQYADGSVDYLCQVSSNEAESKRYFELAQSQLNQCLNGDWITESSQTNNSIKTSYKHIEKSTIIILDTGKSFDKTKPWMTSLQIKK